MKIFSFLFSFLLAVNIIYALEVPFLSGRVIDEAGILSEETKASLESKLKEHEKQTSNQVVVLTIPSLEGEVLEEFSIKVATTWKLGQKKKDNGVLLLIAKGDRKLRIEVGYGLEGTLSDVICNRIIRNDITPLFKKGDFSGGVEKGVDSILAVITGTYANTNEVTDSTESSNTDKQYSDFLNSVGDSDIPILFRIPFGLIFFAVITPFTILTAVTPYIGWFLYFFLMPFYGTFPVVVFGKWGALFLPCYIVIMFLLKIYFGFTKEGKKTAEKYAAKLNSSGRYRSGSGSSWSSSSGSSSSGGFSGGGGSFGGGGSSGSW